MYLHAGTRSEGPTGLTVEEIKCRVRVPYSNIVHPNMLNDRSPGLAAAGMSLLYQICPSRLNSLKWYLTRCLASVIRVDLHSAAELDEVWLDVQHDANKRKCVEDGV